MEEEKRKVGRPKGVKKRIRFEFLLSDEENKIIEEKAKTLGISKGEFVRKSATNVKLLETQPSKELQEIKAEIRKAGIYLSQISRNLKSSSSNILFMDDLKKIREGLGETLKKLR